jgi:hypothetical protein
VPVSAAREAGYGIRVLLSKFLLEVWTMRSIGSLGLVLAISTAMVAQGPPIKMGLWETNSVVDNGDGSPTKAKMRSCITTADWEKMVQGSMPQRPGCTNSLAKTATGYSFDISCNSSQMTMKVHSASHIVDAEHIQGEMHMTTVFSGKTNNVVTRSDGHYVSASCGAVKPGAPKMVE